MTQAYENHAWKRIHPGKDKENSSIAYSVQRATGKPEEYQK